MEESALHAERRVDSRKGGCVLLKCLLFLAVDMREKGGCKLLNDALVRSFAVVGREGDVVVFGSGWNRPTPTPHPSPLSSDLLEDFPCRFHDEGVFDSVDPLLEVLQRLSLYAFYLLDEDGLPSVDLLHDLVHHDTRPLDLPVLVGLVRSLYRVCTVKRTGEGGVEVDDLYPCLDERLEEGLGEDVHEPGEDDEGRPRGQDLARQQPIVVLPRLARVALLVGQEREDLGSDPMLLGPHQPVRVFPV